MNLKILQQVKSQSSDVSHLVARADFVEDIFESENSQQVRSQSFFESHLVAGATRHHQTMMHRAPPMQPKEAACRPKILRKSDLSHLTYHT